MWFHDQVIKERHEGTATAKVDVTIVFEPVREGIKPTYQFVYAVPDPGLTWTHSPRVTTRICGPGAKFSGLLPGSGPDVDQETTDTKTTPGTADLIRWGVPSQEIDAATPDNLSGRQPDVISTDADEWETFWDLTLN